MTRQDLQQSHVSLNRRQQRLLEVPEVTVAREEKRRVGEVAGGTAAECAAIWCCCPCMTMNLLVLAVYKVPTAICRKAWRKQRGRMLKKKKKALLQQQQQQQQQKQKSGAPSSFDESEIDSFESSVENHTVGDESTETDDFEMQMWGQFYGTGFWRSPSQMDV